MGNGIKFNELEDLLSMVEGEPVYCSSCKEIYDFQGRICNCYELIDFDIVRDVQKSVNNLSKFLKVRGVEKEDCSFCKYS